jgi:hypothetical protein
MMTQAPFAKGSRLLFLLAFAGWAFHLESAGLPLLPLKQVEAEHVDLEDKTLHLIGHVKVVHEIGVLHCDEGTLLLPEEKKDGGNVAVNTIFLKGNVAIDFSDGSHLVADEGKIDCQALEGTFIAIPPAKVTYTSFATDEHQQIPVRATGRALKAKIIKTPLGYSLSSMRGEGAVNIQYLRPIPLPHGSEGLKEEKNVSKKEASNE